jgi:hypothetical protein
MVSGGKIQPSKGNPGAQSVSRHPPAGKDLTEIDLPEPVKVPYSKQATISLNELSIEFYFRITSVGWFDIRL